MTHRLATALSFSFILHASAQSAEKITYADHARAVMENKCFSCHNPDKKKGDLDLTSFAGVMTGGGGGAVVDPGNPDSSKLILTITKKEEPFMPPEGSPLNPKEIELLSKWIAGGVLETSSSVAKKSNNPKISMEVAGGAGKPEGPIARPEHVLLEPVVVPERTTAITAMGASPWTSLVAFAAPKQVLLYDTDTRQLAGVFPYPEGYARSVKFSRNGSLLVIGGGKGGKFGHAVVFDVKTGRRVTEIGKENDQVMCADISPNQKQVAIASTSKKIKVYDTATGEEEYVISKHTEWGMCASFSPDGVLLATSDRNGNVMVWEADGGGEFYPLGAHKSSCVDLSWRADSNVLASCSTDGTVILWEMGEGKQLKTWAAHGGGVQAVSFTPDGRVLTCGNDGLTRLWDINGTKISEAASQGDIVTRVVALADGKGAVTANWRGEIKQWDIAKFEARGDLPSNPAQIAQRIKQTEARIVELTGKITPSQDAVTKAGLDVKAKEDALAKVRAESVANDARIKAIPGEIKAAEDLIAQTKVAREKLVKDTTARTELIKQFTEKGAKFAAIEKQLAAVPKPGADAAKNAEFKKQADALTAQITAAKQALGAAPAPVADLDKAIAEADAKIKAASDSIPVKRAEKPKAEALVKGFPDRIKAAEGAVAASKGALAAAQGAAKFMADELAALQKAPALLKAAQFNTGVLGEKDKLLKLEDDLASFTAAQKENEEAKIAAAARIEASRKTIADATAGLPALEAAFKKLAGEYDAEQAKFAPVQAVVAAAAAKLDEQKKALAAKEAELAAITKTRDDGLAAAKKAADDISKQIDVLKKQLVEATAKAAAPVKAADEKKAAIAKAEAELAAAQKPQAPLKAAADQKAAELKAKDAEIAKLNAEVDAAQRGLNAAKAVAIGKPDMAAMVAEAQKNLDAKKAAHATALPALNPVKQAAQAALNTFNASNGTVVAKEKLVVQAKHAAEAAEKAAAPLRSKKQQIEGSIAAQQKTLTEKQSVSGGIEKDFAAQSQVVNAAIAAAKAAQPALEKALADATAAKDAGQKIVDAKAAEVGKAQGTVEATKKSRADAEAAIAAAQKEIPQRDKSIAEIKAEIARITPQLEPQRAKVKQLQDQYLAMLPK